MLKITEFNKCTCVKVNKEKMDLIKSKGLKLQCILDKAMDKELELECLTNKEEKVNLLNAEIEKLERQKQEATKNTEKHINAIIKNLEFIQQYEEKQYDTQIQQLKLEKDYLVKHCLKNKK